MRLRALRSAGFNHADLDPAAFARGRPSPVVVNTSRGAVVDTRAAIAARNAGRLGGLGLDVCEEEADLFSADRSVGAAARE